MDEGRLGIVVRQEERHRKFVYMMNDIVRAQLGLYSNCLAREQHEASIKLVSSCVEVRRSIVKQKVLRKCLEMRKCKVMARDSLAHFGQYGGKPLWAMSRDIERVIANNHPRIRRMRRAEEMMRKSLENGAILDEDAVARRMEAFFQVKQGRQQQQQQNKKFATALQNPFKLPPLDNAAAANRLQAAQKQRSRYEFKGMSLKESHAKSANKENTTSDPRPQKDELYAKEKHTNVDNTPSIPSLQMDRSGRLVGVRTSHLHNAADVIEEKDEEQDETEAPDAENAKNTGERSSNVEHSRNEDNGQNMDNGQKMDNGQNIDNEQTMENVQNMDNVQNGKHARRVGVVKPPKEIAGTVEEESSTDKNSKVSSMKPHAQNGEKNESQTSVFETSEGERGKPRSTLILPPIETSKALVSRK